MFLAVFVATIPFAVFDFDPHHDGYLLAAAIAVNDGSVLFRDVFTQYGPITTWWQALWIGILPEQPVLALRASNLALIFITGILIGDLGRVAPQGTPLTSAGTWLIAILWLLTNDVFYGVAMHPWSSMISSFITISIAYVGALALRTRTQSVFGSNIFFFGIGVLVGLLPFARQSVGVVALSLLVVLLLLWVSTGILTGKEAFVVVVGMASSIVGILTALWGTNSINAWWEQSVLWPLEWATQAGGASPFSSMLELCIQYSPYVAAIGLSFWMTRRFPDKTWVFAGATVLTLALSSLALVGFPEFGEASNSPHGFGEALRAPWTTAIHSINIRFVQLLFVALVFALLVGIWLSMRRLLETGGKDGLPFLLLVISLGVATLSQAIPVTDTRHIWWSLPSLLVVAALLLGEKDLDQDLLRLSAPSLGVWFLSLLVTAGGNLLLVEREPYGPNTVAAGMYSRAGNVERLQRETDFFLGIAKMDRVYLVSNGHLSVIDGEYLSQDAYFVSWGPAPPLKSRVAAGTEIVASAEELEVFSVNGLMVIELSALEEEDLYLVKVLDGD